MIINVNNYNSNKNFKQKNEAFEEANEIVNYIERNNLKEVFIITPFVNQKELRKSKIKGVLLTPIPHIAIFLPFICSKNCLQSINQKPPQKHKLKYYKII